MRSSAKGADWLAAVLGLVGGGILYVLVAFAEAESKLAESQVSIDPLGGISVTSSRSPFWVATALLAVVCFVAGWLVVILARRNPRESLFGTSGALLGIVVLALVGGFGGPPIVDSVREGPTLGPSVILAAGSSSVSLYVIIATLLLAIVWCARMGRARVGESASNAALSSAT